MEVISLSILTHPTVRISNMMFTTSEENVCAGDRKIHLM